jgi:hypothetical protein
MARVLTCYMRADVLRPDAGAAQPSATSQTATQRPDSPLGPSNPAEMQADRRAGCIALRRWCILLMWMQSIDFQCSMTSWHCGLSSAVDVRHTWLRCHREDDRDYVQASMLDQLAGSITRHDRPQPGSIQALQLPDPLLHLLYYSVVCSDITAACGVVLYCFQWGSTVQKGGFCGMVRKGWCTN